MITKHDKRALQKVLQSVSIPLQREYFAQLLELPLFALVESIPKTQMPLSFLTIIESGVRKIVCFSERSHAKTWTPRHVLLLEMHLFEILTLVPEGCGIALDPLPLLSQSVESRKAKNQLVQTTGVSTEEPERMRVSHRSSVRANEERFEDSLREDLRTVCARFPQIIEAYYLFRGNEANTSVVVGVLCQGLHSEMRYYLIDAFAEVSNAYFDSPSAIEVYDDLNVSSSRSWDLFNAMPPLYTRDTSSSGSTSKIKQSQSQL